MSYITRVLIINNIKLSLNASLEEAFLIAQKRLRQHGIDYSECTFKIFKKSVDARKKHDIKFVVSVCITGSLPHISDSTLSAIDATFEKSTSLFDFEYGSDTLPAPPVIVGSGPCGMFAALILAERGYCPIVIERGGSISERKKKVGNFNINKILDPDNNIQFGAGGAGTFSDGKLVTRINDPASNYILQRFVEFGAPPEILYQAKPHIGTDILEKIVDNMLECVKALGGNILYNTKYIGASSTTNIRSIHTSNGDIACGAVILAIGHSARDTYASLINSNMLMEPKAFSVGMRIEHKTTDIDKAMYGSFAGHPALCHAEYNLSYNTKERGVYTFCMCPGGEVVAATSEELGTVVNGMSCHARNGENSNSAVVCSIFKEDYGNNVKAAIQYQQSIEHAAFRAGGSDYSAPIVTVGDFLNGTLTRDPYYVIPTYMNGSSVRLASPDDYLPNVVSRSIQTALLSFDKRIEGFANAGAILTGAETRTSAPLRILRDPITRLAIGYRNLYPAGEGAGYAGGITSAAVDGIRTAISLMKKYKPMNSNG